MLTKAGLRDDPDDDHIDMDEWFAMSDEQRNAEMRRVEAESENFYQQLKVRQSGWTPLQRYRYERHFCLINILRCRDRIDRMRTFPIPIDFIIERNRVLLRRHQMRLLDWRQFLKTGVVPPEQEMN